MIIQTEVLQKEVNDIQEFVKEILNFNIDNDDVLYFRGEGRDYKETALQPSIYRNPKHLENEHCIYREIQRFNDYEFTVDKSAFDRLSRMQHYTTLTRLIDLSEDALTALHFAISTRQCSDDAVVYVVAIKKNKIKYYDSDAVSVISNLVKIPLINGDVPDKSKESIARDANKILEECKFGKYNFKYFIDKYNELDSTKFLLHEIKEEKGYFSSIINPEHIFSIQCVKPKLSNTRIYGQKGVFLLFGLNSENFKKEISIIKYDENNQSFLSVETPTHPITKIMKIKIGCKIKLKTLEKLGITTPYIYTGLDKVSEYFRDKDYA